MDGVGSHLPILEAILSGYPACKHVVEFGPGTFSTEFFLTHGLHVVAIELNPAWAEKFKNTYSNQIENKQLDLIALATGYSELHILPELLDRHADLLFVDGGNPGHRSIIAQTAIIMDSASVIVMHDSEEKIYGYHNIILPGSSPQTEAWTAIEIRDYRPWTMVCSRHPAAIRDMSKGFKEIKVYIDDALRTKEYLR